MFFQKEKAKKVIFSVVRDLYWRDIKAILKSNNLQYNTYASLLGRWDKQLVDQASDVPGIIFFFMIFYRLKANVSQENRALCHVF